MNPKLLKNIYIFAIPFDDFRSAEMIHFVVEGFLGSLKMKPVLLASEHTPQQMLPVVKML